jgi:hypothetical protein
MNNFEQLFSRSLCVTPEKSLIDGDSEIEPLLKPSICGSHLEYPPLVDTFM